MQKRKEGFLKNSIHNFSVYLRVSMHFLLLSTRMIMILLSVIIIVEDDA